jgi:hypothetical protein
MFRFRLEPNQAPQGENTMCRCNAIDGPVYYVSSEHHHTNAEKGGEMTQKLFEHVKEATQHATYDHVHLDLPDDAICDIVKTAEKNKRVLRFLARR